MDNQVLQYDKLALALSKAQSKIKAIKKDAVNPFFKANYVDLSSCLDYALPILSAEGLSVAQTTVLTSDRLLLKTILLHSSGQFIESLWPIGPINLKQQELGSATTYSRRFSFMAIAGLSGTDEDDDGNNASGRTEEKPPKPIKNYAPPANETRLDYLTRLVTEKKIDKKKVQQACEMYVGKPTLAKDLTPEQLEQVIKHLSVL